MRSLVTGASGFVGSHLVEHLLACGDEVIGTTFGEGAGLSCRTMPLDITDREACRRVLAEVKPDSVYHIAGIASPPAVAGDPMASLLVNVGGVHAVLGAAAALPQPPHVLVVSSGEVYGGAGDNGKSITEDISTAPRNDYAVSKIMAEEVALLFARRNNLPVTIARPFNHTGPRQSEAFVVAAFAKQLALIVNGKQPPIIEVGNLGARRDFSDVRDVVRAYRLLVNQGVTGTFNVASGNGVSIADILRYLIDITGVSVTIQPDPKRMRPAEVPLIVGSAEKLKEKTGWMPQFTLKETLADTLDWWVQGGFRGEVKIGSERLVEVRAVGLG
jgi:GDP-4-dehydro-6-deoxy-D-mannose reductase